MILIPIAIEITIRIFFVEMKDGTYQIIEIKGDNKLEDNVVQRKKEAALALTTNSNMIYRMIPGSFASMSGIVDPDFDRNILPYEYHKTESDFGLDIAADSGEVKGEGY